MRAMWNQDAYTSALCFAALAHDGQFITDTVIPYVVHPVQVAMEVKAALAVENVENPDLAVLCALLHDVLEDTPTPPAALEAAFGRPVMTGVAALSKNPALSSPEAMHDSLARIRQEPREVWMVKLADRINNLRPPPSLWTKDKCTAYSTEARLILDTLGTASPLLSARLAEKIENYTQYTV